MNERALIIHLLDSARDSLGLVGGKARSLMRLSSAGLPVPNGFVVSTDAYWQFVAGNDLQNDIRRSVKDHPVVHDAVTVGFNSARIREAFATQELPAETTAAILNAYAAMGDNDPAVSVRSSATAEDLPDLSFAGQHDSFLNVRGDTAVVDAVRRCWASLWSARAISYRERMGVDQGAVAMAVVVQRMVAADVSGILFTARPETGDRSELVVNASFGLGEAIVGGDVTPDEFVLERDGFEITSATIGAKETMIVPADKQGTETQSVPSQRRQTLSLSKELLAGLCAIGLEVEHLFGGVPQDIEWAFKDGKCWVLQSRPITNLPTPFPQDIVWNPPTEKTLLIRRQVVENMPEPLSPLFADLYLPIGLEQAADNVMVEMGMPFDMTAD